MVKTLGYGAQPRAEYAVDPEVSRGRLFPEPESPTRTPFQRDRDRIIHSAAFRRLKHKTQVFVYHEGDHFRTRLTHTIEVSQIARSLRVRCGWMRIWRSVWHWRMILDTLRLGMRVRT